MIDKIIKFKKWFYEFKHGHPFLLNEEVDIICKTRENPRFKHYSDRLIKIIIQIRIEEMYKDKFPSAKKYLIF